MWQKVVEYMPIKPLRPCKHIGCRELTRDGYCMQHLLAKQEKEVDKRKEYDKQRRPSYHQWYSGRQWRVLRMHCLKCNPLCAICKQHDKLTPATVVDHIISHKGNVSMFFDTNNLQSLCKQCHDVKTAKEDGYGNKRSSDT